MFNRVILIGNLTRDPELKYTTNGTPVASCSIAVNRRFKNANGERDVDFFNLVAWRQTAEFLCNYGAKGKKVALEGTLQTRNYVNREGQKVYVTEIVVDQFELLSPLEDKNGAEKEGGTGARQPAATAAVEADEFYDPFSE